MQLGYEQVIFVPSNIPAHKDADPCTEPELRLEMLERATEGSDIIVDSCEIERGGVSYTYETVLHLEEKYQISAKPGLVVGDDLIEGLHRWKKWDQLKDMVDLIVAHRIYETQIPCDYEHTYIDNIILPISSSGIRERIKDGRTFRYLVPESVYQFIQQKGMYAGC